MDGSVEPTGFTLSMTMSIPRIYLGGPISFFEKDLLKAFFSISIFMIPSNNKHVIYHISGGLGSHLCQTSSRTCSHQLASCGILGRTWWDQTSGTIARVFFSTHKDASSMGIPGSPFLSWRILLVVACRSPLPGHHAGTLSWRPAIPTMPQCSAPSRWMSSWLLVQRSHWNPHLSSAEKPSPQCGLCILVNFRHPLTLVCTPICPEVPSLLSVAL